MTLNFRKSTALFLGSIVGTLAFTSASFSDEKRLLWGDTHLHSSYSADAYMAGNRSAGPDAAYRYAKGEPVIHPYARNRVQITEPLDFLAVADHAEYLGVLPVVLGGEFEQPEASIFQELKSWAMITVLNYATRSELRFPTCGCTFSMRGRTWLLRASPGSFMSAERGWRVAI
jgi:hypothetical protein